MNFSIRISFKSNKVTLEYNCCKFEARAAELP
jgi:hypothetical protein